jgi:hypothetical protein
MRVTRLNHIIDILMGRRVVVFGGGDRKPMIRGRACLRRAPLMEVGARQLSHYFGNSNVTGQSIIDKGREEGRIGYDNE